MTRRELGAGVSVMWVIFLIVLLLGAGAYIYFVQSEIEGLNASRRSAIADKEEAENLLENARQAHFGLSEEVGFRTEGAVLSSTSALAGKLVELKARYPNDIGSADSTVELILERMATAIDKHQQDAQAARSQFDTELAQRQQAESAKDDIARSMQASLDTVKDELVDANSRVDSTQETADNRYNSLDDTYQQAQSDFRSQESSFQEQLGLASAEIDMRKGRINSLAQKVKILGVDDDPNAEDGKVIDASTSGDVYIDVGSKHLLRKGTRFTVFRFDKGGRRVVKGQIEVRELGNTSSMGRVVSQVDMLDPIAAGDRISNPYFNRGRTKNFVLLGNFPAYGRTFLKQRLEDLGASVSDSVNSEVDAVILGAKAPEEDAVELTELPEYKLAEDLNIQVLRISELEAFLRP